MIVNGKTNMDDHVGFLVCFHVKKCIFIKKMKSLKIVLQNIIYQTIMSSRIVDT